MSALQRLLERVRAVLPRPDGSLAVGRRRAARRPRTTLRTGPAVPALVLRATLLAVVAGAGAVVAASPTEQAVAAALGVVVAVRPHAALLGITVAVLVAMLALSPGPWWALVLLVVLTHAVLRVGAVADAVSWRGRVEVAVLRGALPGFLAVQAVAQVAVGLALLLDGAAPVPWLVVVAVAGLAVLGWASVHEIRTRR
ncbi:hypothetical protein SAMN05216184_104237 [Georgenia satyanarayanai]|uniref:Uncharacterized protein n=1 Tax=Georgenia satyanarayanai TaxID=860221 RepID=A0A2Y9A863_9MICO|nr:hypothetical protein [Georgenia satyanarayanai]PYG00295.1 hypothetical protein A8987_104237 [Georgenia satyanarayanai]SSA40681.1 hypothetical protein SAMN05216184_104237 [Georgenia satyanarayanai]